MIHLTPPGPLADETEETLAVGDNGYIVVVSRNGGLTQVFQLRRDGEVIAEAATLRMLAELIRQEPATSA